MAIVRLLSFFAILGLIAGLYEVTSSASGCQIKGNITADGERIYHLPGGEFYRSTVISKAQGERWFCTVDEARAAGWRPSRS